MPTDNQSLLEIGRIAKPHGLRGEVVVELFTNREERLAPGSVLSTAGGSLVVRQSRPHQHRWVVSFNGVDSREDAEALHGVVLSAEPLEDADALWVHELVGCGVLDVGGDKVGMCVAVLANPAGDLIETDTGVLIPLRFVVDSTPTSVRVDPPPGLYEVNQ